MPEDLFYRLRGVVSRSGIHGDNNREFEPHNGHVVTVFGKDNLRNFLCLIQLCSKNSRQHASNTANSQTELSSGCLSITAKVSRDRRMKTNDVDRLSAANFLHKFFKIKL